MVMLPVLAEAVERMRLGGVMVSVTVRLPLTLSGVEGLSAHQLGGNQLGV
jgi:hypothetical protein